MHHANRYHAFVSQSDERLKITSQIQARSTGLHSFLLASEDSV